MAKITKTSQPTGLVLGRREFLIAAGGLILSITPLSLIGCGGGGGAGGGGGGGKMVPLAGTINLPPGFGIPVSQLSVTAGLGKNPVTPPNAFVAKIGNQAPSLATLQDSQGNAVLIAFLDPSKPNNVIDSMSTAIALAFFMVGGYTLPSSSTANVLSLISSAPSVAALALVIQQRLAVDPLADIEVKLQRIVVRAVGYAFDAGRQPTDPHVTDEREGRKRLHPLPEIS